MYNWEQVFVLSNIVKALTPDPQVCLQMWLLCFSVTKGSLAAAIVFMLERKGMIDAPHAVIYFGVVIFFVYFRLSSLLLGIHDPFVPFENLFCAIFMGGMVDALKRAVTREPEAAAGSGGDSKNSTAKPPTEKKND